MGLLRPRHYLGTRKGQLSGSRESGSSEDPSPAGRVTVPLVTQKLSKLVRNVSLGFSYSFLSQEMCTHRQSAWHSTAVSKENLHRDGILVPVDLFLIFPVTALPMNGTSCLSFARGIKKKKSGALQYCWVEGFKIKISFVGISNSWPIWKSRGTGIGRKILEVSTTDSGTWRLKISILGKSQFLYSLQWLKKKKKKT